MHRHTEVDLVAGYKDMANDVQRESEAHAWCEALLVDWGATNKADSQEPPARSQEP